ncbi:hypothetical protein SBRCBS47491_002675 [Sporothrix bragantina]|uniref:PLD phosphodiesterase domain-containing protein n=1 Tax=Sporothrix bragantina TaxID=671064 RepID=A0ABP0B8S8_9PEZI
MADPHSFTRKIVAQLQAVPREVTDSELPAYNYHGEDVVGDSDNAVINATDAAVAQFASSSTPHIFRLGTGASQFASLLLPALLKARREILFVTCFWAKSKSLSDLSEALDRLATARSFHPQNNHQPLRIRICFSSRSLFQKLLHTTSRDGYVYPPSTWVSLLGLPSPELLAAGGIDLSVKSLFFLPFSVMHPKYMIIDRQRAFLPSCNVSWEPWLEGCVEVTGEAIGPLLSFHSRTWGDDLPGMEGEGELQIEADKDSGLPGAASPFEIGPVDVDGPGSIVVRFPSSLGPLPTVILPSSHHRNPLFRPFPWQDYAPPPPTPLNLAMLQLLASATRRIYIQTPNVTTESVIVALLTALGRGVDVDIVTGDRLMVYEQILTAGTTTARCIRSMIKRYTSLMQQQPGQINIGRLAIAYFRPLDLANKGSDEEQGMLSSSAQSAPSTSHKKNSSGFVVATEQPIHSHIKLTIVDGEHTVLGSGNMDRASFFTSQELGILFHSTAFAEAVRTAVDRVLDGRLKQVYPPPFSE